MTSGWPNFAVSTAILMVQAIAVSQPPPSAKPLIGRDHRLAEILDEIEDLLAEAARLLCLERRDMRELADVGAGDESLVAGACQDDAAYRGVVARILEGRPQILPGRRIQRVEHLGPIDRHIGDCAFFLVEDICQRQ